MSDTYDGPQSAPRPQKVKGAKEPPKIPTGTWVEVCPDDPDLRTWGMITMCLPGAKVELRLRGGAMLTVPRSVIRLQPRKTRTTPGPKP